MNIRLTILTILAVCTALWAAPEAARGQMFVSVNSNPFTNGGSNVYQYDPTGSTGTPTTPPFLSNLSHQLANDSRGTRVAWSEAAKTHAEHFAKLPPSSDHKRAIAAKNWHSVAAGVHGWDGRDAGMQINLNVLSLPSARL